MQLAETLGIDPEEIVPQVGDTNSVAETEGSYGSRTTFATGWAAIELGKKLITELTERAALLWDVSPHDIDYCDGEFCAGSQRIRFKEIAKQVADLEEP